jgi:hypothetical protein
MSTDADQRREWRVRRKQEVEAANKRHAAEDSAHDKLHERLAARSGPPGAVTRHQRFP